ncbi:putative calcium-binding protein CML36 [Platanthera guangdongensis]|uniref:Calcium-binding protein CML36 n=1 Tax=Platanthera guangdongensis TaxID=2320717 RepID=A0ABR2MZZ7_9ASPA
MKFISCPPSFFRSSKKKRRGNTSSPSFASNTASSSSSDQQTTPKSVLSPKQRRRTGSRDEHYSSSSSSDAAMCENERAKVTRRELEAVLRRLQPEPPTDEEVAAMLDEAARCGVMGQFSVEEMVAALGLEFAGPASPDLRETFAVFDGDGDGKISAEELRGLFATLGDEGCTLENCRRMIGVVDTDGDGFVCFEDFVRMMRGQM